MRFLLLVAGVFACADAFQPRAITPKIPGGKWVSTWGAMPQRADPTYLPPPPFNTSTRIFFNSTIRQTIKASIGGEQIRIRLSNIFGGSDLSVTSVTVALPFNGSAGASAIYPETLQTLTFSGSKTIIIPNGALAVSDPINFSVKPQSIFTISIYLANGQSGTAITSHHDSQDTTWFSYGDYTNAVNLTDPSTASNVHWYFINSLEVWAVPAASTFAIVGDSITDGTGSELNKNNRWADQLFARMQLNPSTSNIGIINQGAGANRILTDGTGPNTQGRIERDILSHSGVRYAMIFQGVNDIGNAPSTTAVQSVLADRLILAHKQIITRVHTAGIPIFAATVLPFGWPPNSTWVQHFDEPTREAARQKVNGWIRTSGAYDAVLDFDATLRDPRNNSRLSPLYDSGDGIHPNVAGYRALAESFPLDLFSKFAHGVDSFQ